MKKIIRIRKKAVLVGKPVYSLNTNPFRNNIRRRTQKKTCYPLKTNRKDCAVLCGGSRQNK